jgi:hypothetical protein
MTDAILLLFSFMDQTSLVGQRARLFYRCLKLISPEMSLALAATALGGIRWCLFLALRWGEKPILKRSYVAEKQVFL